MKAWLASLLVLASFCPAQAQERATLWAEVDTTAVRPGAPLHLDIRVEHPAGARVDFPDPAEQPFPGFQIRQVSEVQGETLDNGQARTGFRYRLVAHVLDTTLVIPSLSIAVHSTDSLQAADTLVSAAIPVRIVSGIDAPADAQVEARPERPPRALESPFPWLKVLLWSLVLALLGWLGWRWWRRRRRGAVDSPYFAPLARLRPPHEVAIERLEALAASELAREGPAKAFYTEATDILREYVAGRYGVDAPDLTSAELLVAATELDLSQRTFNLLRGQLQDADLVKFAKVSPPWSEWSEVVERAKEIVLATAPLPPPSVEDCPGPDAEEAPRG